jgi:glycosyltransferase involved in cell wall biosynthesis
MTSSKNPIRVLLIAPSLSITGGQSVQADKLLATLRELPNLEMRFYPIDPRPPRWLEWARRIPGVRTLLMFAVYNVGLLRRVPGCDILHVFTAGLSSFTLWTLPALLLARVLGKRFVMHYHDGQAEQHLTEWRSAAPSIALADKLIVPSGFLVDAFRKYGISAEVVPNIVDLDRFRFRERRQLRPVFMTNRMLEPLYNVACIIRAFAIVQARFPEASLTIAHDGPSRPSLEALVAELSIRNVQFVGRVNYAEIPALYDEADLYVMTPNIDNMPGSLLECFASGLPVVATKAGGIPYIAQDRETALLVDLDDHAAVADRALELLESPDLVSRLTQNGYREAQKYGTKPVQERWSAIYRELSAPRMG